MLRCDQGMQAVSHDRAGIEASITEKGYTFHVYESYSAACNSAMFSFHSALAGYVRVLTDYKNGKMWQMFAPNATYPNGVCTSEPLDPKNNLVVFEGNQIASSARFLGFLSSSGVAAEFQPPAAGFPDLVRCVGQLHRALRAALLPGCTVAPPISSSPCCLAR